MLGRGSLWPGTVAYRMTRLDIPLRRKSWALGTHRLEQKKNKEKGVSLQGLETQVCPLEAQESNRRTSPAMDGRQGQAVELGDVAATWGFRSQALLCIKARCPERKEQTRSSAVPWLSPECCDSDPNLFCSPDIVTWPQQHSWAKGFTLTRVLHGILHTKRSQCC